MKKLAISALVASALLSGAASATTYTYTMNNAANQWSTFAGSNGGSAVWNTTLTVNDAVGSNSSLVGSIVSGGYSYNINMTLVNAYNSGRAWTNGSSLYWQYFTGTLTRGNSVFSLSDVGGGGTAYNAMDARVGINGGPYNSVTNMYELGFWAGTVADINVLITCASSGYNTNANGSCGAASTSSSSSGGTVPVPGSLALLGLGLVGLGLRRKLA